VRSDPPNAKAAPIGSGDIWTWTGIDADSKLIVSWFAGDRHHGARMEFMSDLRARLANKVQLTTDGHRAYLSAVEKIDFDADYAMLIKIYGDDSGRKGRYSPPSLIGIKTETIRGNPDPEHINTSFAERHNLTMRMQMRRFTRLTNGFSKKIENHSHALALYFFWYNWVRSHKAHKLTPAMAAGLVSSPMELTDLCSADRRTRTSANSEQTAGNARSRRVRQSMANDPPSHLRMGFGYPQARAAGLRGLRRDRPPKEVNRIIDSRKSERETIRQVQEVVENDPEWRPFVEHWIREGVSADEILYSLRLAEYDAWRRQHARPAARWRF
jgi:IS1 family transposase